MREPFLKTRSTRVVPDSPDHMTVQLQRRIVRLILDGTVVRIRLDRKSERAFQASQSAFTFRHTRLTVSLPTAPPNRAASARRTRRVLVPARYVLAISASAASVRR